MNKQEVLKDYKKQRQQGIQDPVFKASSIPGLKVEDTEWQ